MKRGELTILSAIVVVVFLVFNATNKSIHVDRPIIVQKVNHGKVTGKSTVGKLYTIDCGAYGKFLVTKEQYDSVNVGDDIPSYLKGRGK